MLPSNYLYLIIICFYAYSFKHSDTILIIFKNRPILLLDGTLTGTTSLSKPGSNCNEEVFYIPHTSRFVVSLPDAVLCHTQDTPF